MRVVALATGKQVDISFTLESKQSEMLASISVTCNRRDSVEAVFSLRGVSDLTTALGFAEVDIVARAVKPLFATRYPRRFTPENRNAGIPLGMECTRSRSGTCTCTSTQHKYITSSGSPWHTVHDI